MAKHNTLGKQGEEAAMELLLKKGYTIRHTNWRSGKLELDLVAQIGTTVVFVEVKSRSNDHYLLPEQAVDKMKIRRIIQAAEAYIHLFNINLDARFDIITLIGSNDNFKIEHIEDAFFPTIN